MAVESKDERPGAEASVGGDPGSSEPDPASELSALRDAFRNIQQFSSRQGNEIGELRQRAEVATAWQQRAEQLEADLRAAQAQVTRAAGDGHYADEDEVSRAVRGLREQQEKHQSTLDAIAQQLAVLKQGSIVALTKAQEFENDKSDSQVRKQIRQEVGSIQPDYEDLLVDLRKAGDFDRYVKAVRNIEQLAESRRKAESQSAMAQQGLLGGAGGLGTKGSTSASEPPEFATPAQILEQNPNLRGDAEAILAATMRENVARITRAGKAS